MIQNILAKSSGWLLFFYSLPSKPVGNRMKIWRKLTRIGAVPFKGSGHILPNNEENYEYFQWLTSEVTDRGGEGAFVQVDRVESMPEKEVVDLFIRSREKEYLPIEEEIETVERGLITLNQGGDPESGKKLIETLNQLAKEFEHIKKVDFFASRKGLSLEKRIKAVRDALKTFSPEERAKTEKSITQKNHKDYQGKIWVTRKRPHVDRMASAWLIRKFIDPEAAFKFIGESGTIDPKADTVTFDIKNGVFTHQSDLCTFEVLIRSFGLKDKAIKKMAEVIHQIDLRDKKHPAPEAFGMEELIKGIRKTVTDDQEILEKGMALFEMLYASKTV
jgi:hypothetical protein